MTTAADARAAAALASRFRDAARLLDAVAMMGSAALEVKSTTTRRRKAAPANPTNNDAVPPASLPAGAPLVAGAGRLSRKEIRGAIRAAIMAHPKRRDAEIAAGIGCHQTTVSKERARLEAGEDANRGGFGNSRSDSDDDGDADDDAEPAEKAKPPPGRKVTHRTRAIRDALADPNLTNEQIIAAFSLSRPAFFSHCRLSGLRRSHRKDIEFEEYNWPADEVGEKADAKIQKLLQSRAAKVQAGWTKNHERKANSYYLPPLECEPVPAPMIFDRSVFRDVIE